MQCHVCWWPANKRSQSISIHGITLEGLKYQRWEVQQTSQYVNDWVVFTYLYLSSYQCPLCVLQMANASTPLLANTTLTTTTVSPGALNVTPTVVTDMPDNSTAINSNQSLYMHKIFLQTHAADGIAGSFAFAAILVTVYQVSSHFPPHFPVCYSITVSSHGKYGISNHRQLKYLFNNFSGWNKIKLCITDPLWRECTTHWWIPLTKNQ